MAAENARYTVADYVTLQRGNTYSGKLVGEPGPALLGLGSIEPGGGFRHGKYKSFGGDCPPKIMLRPGDLYVALKGATKDGSMVGSIARLPTTIPSGRLTQDTARLDFIDKNPEIANHLYWVLRTPQYRQYCGGRLTGSASASFSREDFLSYPVPPISKTSKKLVNVFEAVETKIELNRRMNETLEAMARAIFKSWFVDFDPVRAKAEGRQPFGMDAATAALFPNSFQDSPLGELPTGWRQSSLEQVIEIHDSKRIPLSGRQRSERQGPYPYYGAASVMDHVDSFLFDGVHILVGEDGSVINDDDTPITQYVWGRFWVNNHAHVLRGKGDISNEYLLLFLRQTNIRAFITGAVQPKLNQGNLCRVPFLIPPSHVCAAFERMVQPMFSELRANTEQSRTLAALRDALLPKLISGEIQVNHGESRVGTTV